MLSFVAVVGCRRVEVFGLTSAGGQGFNGRQGLVQRKKVKPGTPMFCTMPPQVFPHSLIYPFQG